MNVAHISKSDAFGGGASRTASDLTAHINARGHTATHFCTTSIDGFGEQRRSLYGPEPLRRLTAIAHRKMRALGFSEVVPFELPAAYLAGIARDYDVIHFHDLTRAISPFTVRFFSLLRPTFWTFHDCSPITGGCIFPYGCDRINGACGSDGGCPQLHDWPLQCRTDQTRLVQLIKTSLHRTRRVTTIAGSPWMAQTAVRSGKVGDPPTVIPCSADTGLFRPVDDRAALRRELGVPVDAPIVLISGSNLGDPRKGARHSIDAVRACADLSPYVLAIGEETTSEFADALAAIPHRMIGYVRDQRVLARWYAAADVFLFCSIAETGPLSVAETMACGTPFVGFVTGGISEMVVNGENGMSVAVGDTAGLAAALRLALEDRRALGWRAAARERIVAHFSYESYTAKHIALYERAIADWPAAKH